jgi:hypothetical protein
MDTLSPSTFEGCSSPTLESLDRAQRPDPLPACGQCRHAVWLIVDARLNCFCRYMQQVSWDGVKPPVQMCDGQHRPERIDTKIGF